MKFIRSATIVLAILASMMVQQSQAKFLWLDPLQLIKEYCEVAILVKDLEHEHQRKHHHPLVKAVLVDMWNNLVAFINEPSLSTFSLVFIDWSSYLLMPMEGGW